MQACAMIDGGRKMAATYGTGGQSPTSISRTLERVFEEAQLSGEILLCGRNLKEYPKIASKYDLADTVHADFSKNRFTEVPIEVGEFTCLERLICYHNLIRSIPENLVQLQVLTHLNLSRNQLTTLPAFLCSLPVLEVLLANNNKLISLPPEICKLERLMDLDVSCNEITRLPTEIGKLPSLRRLNVRKNLLVEIPPEISKLNLRRIDFSANKISSIPIVFRSMQTLEEMILDHNPLVTPPAHVCTKGKAHIMKYLQREADRNNALLYDTEMKWNSRKSFPQPVVSGEEFRNLSPEMRWKRHTVSSDSGYIDGSDKSSWSLPEVVNDLDEANCLALKTAEAVKEQRQGREQELQRRVSLEIHKEPVVDSDPKLAQTPPTPVNMEDAFTRELQRQKSDYERRKKHAEQLRMKQEEEEREEREREETRRAAIKLQEKRAQIERQREQEAARQREQEEKEEMEEEAERQKRLEQQEREMEEAKKREEAAKLKQDEEKKQEIIKKEKEESVTKSKADNKTKETSKLKRTPVDNCLRKYALGPRGIKDDKKLGTTSTYRRPDAVKMRKPSSESTVSSASNHVQKNGIPDENMNPSPVSSNAPSRSSSTSSIHNTNERTTTKSLSGSRLRLDKTSTSTSNVVRRTKPSTASDKTGPASATNSKIAVTTGKSHTTGTKSNHLTPEEEFRLKHEAILNQQRHESQVLKRRLEEQRSKSTVKDTVNNTKRSPGDSSVSSSSSIKPGTKSGKVVGASNKIIPPSGRRTTKTTASPSTTASPATHHQSDEVLSAGALKLLEEYKDADPNFTIRRHHDQAVSEIQQVESLRNTIQARLKVTLPANLPEALRDGVVLCHLVNQIRPRAVATIHVPSPAVPQLTMAKCRRNVDHFIEACRKIGVDQGRICSAHDILEEKGLAKVALTVSSLVASTSSTKQAVNFCYSSFLSHFSPSPCYQHHDLPPGPSHLFLSSLPCDAIVAAAVVTAAINTVMAIE
ncbi:Leucine-rich repeat and calponin homology domain-containing protein 3,Leucine-rich repeat and calponin homology domain-containing protein 2,Leucine-rich repeat and calponin homology domain-containing protein 1,Leucine-rich repeat and calponin homology domain-containing protein 4 [Acanthosepion pharaonis]|uniref:Calponin-homology (CH) domain-containing protein n=1 Tax=Acanthosepion pharaonis TaxID=158019 RepID=A0A812B3S5_ACAPH|nr:Leucine-rich repeat and calponin homology domain-containing protein 3,Leucine-rich repeat and calponin homology domain-containing protein 2,Leucine-rich repeat and calponin homology domain-containing protein 1,Leucine-rich repeat and calponin homology domain-containing protein 4 [Sepia pharaonis]